MPRNHMTACLALLIVTTGFLSATTASAELFTQLGILDMDANGGINPATGNPWAAGDTYRFAFTTSTIRDATSSNIADYNTFVQSAANASPLNIGVAQGVTWNAIASTATVGAKDNTSTNIAVNGPGETIFLLNGTTIVATDYAALWGGNEAHDNALNLTELLTTPPNDLPGASRFNDTWSGTNRDVLPDLDYGTPDLSAAGRGPLGDLDGDAIGGLWGFTSGNHWSWRFGRATSTQLPFYALSDPLTITAPVPEPEAVVSASIGLIGLIGVGLRCRRRRGSKASSL